MSTMFDVTSNVKVDLTFVAKYTAKGKSNVKLEVKRNCLAINKRRTIEIMVKIFETYTKFVSRINPIKRYPIKGLTIVVQYFSFLRKKKGIVIQFFFEK